MGEMSGRGAAGGADISLKVPLLLSRDRHMCKLHLTVPMHFQPMVTLRRTMFDLLRQFQDMQPTTVHFILFILSVLFNSSILHFCHPLQSVPSTGNLTMIL